MGLTIGFDATAAARQRAGIGRYARELLRALAQRNDGSHYRLFYCSGGDGELPQLDDRFRVRRLPVPDRVTNLIWHRAHLPVPIQLLTGAFDLFHSPDFTAPPTLSTPSIVTVHDLAFIRRPECAFPTLRAYLERVVPRAVREASHVVAVSQHTKRDVMELLGVEEDRITVIFPGVTGAFGQPPDTEAAQRIVRDLGVKEPFILTVGTLEPRKNYVRLLEAYSVLRSRGWRHRLVVVGRRGWLDQPIFDRIRELGLEPHVSILAADDRGLAALYSTADVFVCASVYEGFGIPPLEALACGAPVACSNAASLPEAVGNAALMFDPFDVDAMADTLERLLEDRGLARELAAAGPAQAAQFSWAESADRAAAMYEKVTARA